MRRRLAIAVGVVCTLIVPAQATAAPGGITQLPSPFGCLAPGGAGGACGVLDTAEGASDLVVSPDGRFVYVSAFGLGALSVTALARDPATGRVSFAGCISETALPQCTPMTGVSNLEGIAISPDGANVYVANLAGVAIFDRLANGLLVQHPSPNGCITNSPTAGCTAGRGLDSARGVAVSPDGANVYVASYQSDAIAVFARAPSGALTQLAGLNGCVSDNGAPMCTDGHVLDGAYGVAVSADGKQVYASTFDDHSVIAYNRGAQGRLELIAPPAGCVQQTGAESCQPLSNLTSTSGIAVPPGGGRVYVSTIGPDVNTDAIRLIDVTSAGGLAPRTGAAGCVTTGGAGGCSPGRALDEPRGLAISPDGAQLYAAGNADPGSITVFDLAADGGLAAHPGAEGCARSVAEADCATGPAIAGSKNVALSPDGAHVYGTSALGSAVTAFARELPAGPRPPQPPAARTLVRGRVLAKFARSGRFTLVRRLEVRRLARGTRVTLLCSSRRKGCPRKRRSVRRRGSATIKFTRLFEDTRLRRGVKLELRITARDRVGKVARYTVRRRKLPLKRSLCLPPGARRPARC